MGQIFGKQAPVDPKEVEKIQEARKNYNDFLTMVQTNITGAIQNKYLNPESGNAMIKNIKESVKWLKKNPNASILEINANAQALFTELTRIERTDRPKRDFTNIILIVPPTLQEMVDKKVIDKNQKAKCLAQLAVLSAWFYKNKDEATLIDFQQQETEFTIKCNEYVVTMDAQNQLKAAIQNAKLKNTDELKTILGKSELDKLNALNQQIDIGHGVEIGIVTATQVFFGFLIIVLCLMCGSFAANYAIGRPPAYRVLYFIYGALPFFAPFVLLYTIYKRVKEGRIPMYGILPLSIEPGTTRLGRFLWYPFYWIPDSIAMDQYTGFVKLAESLV